MSQVSNQNGGQSYQTQPKVKISNSHQGHASEVSEKNTVKIRLYQRLQEECAISKVILVKQSIAQAILEILLCLITGGVLLLIYKWIKELRYQCFFSITDILKADSVVVFGPDDDIQILKLSQGKQLLKVQEENNSFSSAFSEYNDSTNNSTQQTSNNNTSSFKIFSYRFNKYCYRNGGFEPYGDSIFDYRNDQILSKFDSGLSEDLIADSKERNGLNKTDIPDKGVFQLVIDELLSPFYIFQMGSAALWIYQLYMLYSYIIIGTSTLSIILKVYKERVAISRLKEFSFFRNSCNVFRNSLKTSVLSDELCFGDKMYLSQGDVAPCDLVLINGSAIVNESMLTGESIPIVKSPLSKNQDLFSENKQNIIYCGSLIQQTSPNLECIVIRIGFDTLKGNLIRSILYPKKHNQISFETDAAKFLLILGVFSIISYLIVLPTLIDLIHQEYILPSETIFKFLNLITISIPPALPTCLSFGISFSLKRLRDKKVYCINPEKINVCGIVRTICFDKTGTLTEEKLSYKQVSSYDINRSIFFNQKHHKEISKFQRLILSSCHSLMIFNGKNIGDPLDIEMFENSGSCILLESSSDNIKAIDGHQVLTQISFNGHKNDFSQNNVISVLKRFQFESEVERMSSLLHFQDQVYLVTKGSPEKIKSICNQESIPTTFDSILREFTQEGYRVIALSYKLVTVDQLDLAKERDHYEESLLFAGFIVFENKLKPETNEHIELLQKNKIQIHMVTGDNALTSLSVAKQCKILNRDSKIEILDIQREGNNVSPKVDNQIIQLQSIFSKIEQEDRQFVMTGAFYNEYLQQIKKENPSVFSLLLSQTKVFARMKPDQKQSLIQQLQLHQNIKQGYSFIGMCGDGANDCQALKDADMGISLGDAEASIAASFTSKVINISIIEYILREGRCCLATSFQCFKFMAIYSIVQCVTTTILYQRGAIPTDYQYLYWDLFIIIPLAFLIGYTDASPNLTIKSPSHRLFSHQNILSVIGQGLIQVVFQIVAIAITAGQSWYRSPAFIQEIIQDSSGFLYHTFDTTILFSISNFQYIFSVISFSIGCSYKKPFYTNVLFTFFLVALLVLSVYTLLSRESQYLDYFTIQNQIYDDNGNKICEMPYYWNFILLIMVVINMIVSIVYEKIVLTWLINIYEKKYPNSVYQGTFVSEKTAIDNKSLNTDVSINNSFTEQPNLNIQLVQVS